MAADEVAAAEMAAAARPSFRCAPRAPLPM